MEQDSRRLGCWGRGHSGVEPRGADGPEAAFHRDGAQVHLWAPEGGQPEPGARDRLPRDPGLLFRTQHGPRGMRARKPFAQQMDLLTLTCRPLGPHRPEDVPGCPAAPAAHQLCRPPGPAGPCWGHRGTRCEGRWGPPASGADTALDGVRQDAGWGGVDPRAQHDAGVPRPRGEAAAGQGLADGTQAPQFRPGPAVCLPAGTDSRRGSENPASAGPG